MKTHFPTIFLIFSILFVTVNVFSQGTFQDLDFESGTVVSSGGAVSAADAFPGWQILYGTAPSLIVGYDSTSIGAAQVTLVDGQMGATPLDGNYSAWLQSANITFPFTLSETVGLSQTALVPSGTESIELDANEEPGGSFVVSVGGQPINMVPLESFVNYELWGGNIAPSLAGEIETLAITQEISSPQSSPSLLQLDDISFSPNPVTVTPEPEPVILMGIGGALFAAYLRFAPKRR